MSSSRDSSAALHAAHGVAAGAEALGQLVADADLHVGVDVHERLAVRVDGDELARRGSSPAAMRLTALLPPPPTPMTLIGGSPSKSCCAGIVCPSPDSSGADSESLVRTPLSSNGELSQPLS